MRVLFVSAGNSKNGVTPIIKNQGDSLKFLDISVDYFPINRKGFFGYLVCTLKLRKHLKHNNYDLIHAHYGLCGIVSLFAKRKHKLIVSFMGDDMQGDINQNGKPTFKSRLIVIVNRFLGSFFYDHIIVKSKIMADTFGQSDKLSIIPNGVCLDSFKELDKISERSELGYAPNDNLVIFVSDPSRREKNYPLAKKACKIADITPIVVHDTLNKELVHYYNVADLLLLTSFFEGSPNVIKEAMACNCPIVCTDVGDVRWTIGETAGCFITSFEEGDVAGKIKLALQFSKITGRTTGRQRIIELGIDANSTARKIQHLYNKVLN